MNKVVFALACHPDDIEFMMSGTLLLLKERGCELHYMNLANGNCGTAELSHEKIIKIRRKEAENAAKFLGAAFHPPLVNDIEVFYEDSLIRKVTAIVRDVEPDIMLIPSLEDYMEDHMNTARVAVTAAFCRGMLNYKSIPRKPIISNDVTLYHALPYGLKDGMKTRLIPETYTDISDVMEKKEKMLAMHQSQKVWLDKSQGLDAYINTMRDMSFEVGLMSKRFKFAEGWRRHSHLGFSAADEEPLSELLK
jgi:N-acetylglucosamine malate deacetylase 1